MRGLISRIFGFVAAVRFPRVLQTFINEKYVSGFKIDMSEFKQPKEYESLTALFTVRVGTRTVGRFGRTYPLGERNPVPTHLGFIKNIGG